MSRRSGVELAAAAAYAALAGLIAAGTTTRLDQWAIDHAMPFAHLGGRGPTTLEALVPLVHAHFDSASAIAANVITVPASFLVSLLLLAAACIALRRCGRRRLAAALAVAWVVANLVEELCKTVLTRPPLHARGLHLVAFDGSYPSGHTLRTVLVAGALAAAWPALRAWAWLWAACSVAMLELAGFHVPTDIAGGLVLSGLLLSLATRWSS